MCPGLSQVTQVGDKAHVPHENGVDGYFRDIHVHASHQESC